MLLSAYETEFFFSFILNRRVLDRFLVREEVRLLFIVDIGKIEGKSVFLFIRCLRDGFDLQEDLVVHFGFVLMIGD